MAGLNVLFVGRDAAPAECAYALEPVLSTRGHTFWSLLGDHLTATQIEEAVHWADVVVLGMSSDQPDALPPELIAAGAAVKAEKPFGFYADTPSAWARAKRGGTYGRWGDRISFFFCLSEADALAAAQVFPNATCIATGNPTREAMATPMVPRDVMRERLGVNPDEKLILIPGHKLAWELSAQVVVTIDVLGSLMLDGDMSFHLVLSPHPKDRQLTAVDPHTRAPLVLHEETIKWSPIPFQVVTADVASTLEMVPAADLVVEFGSTIAIAAALQHKPLVTLGSESLALRNAYYNNEERVTEVVQNGSSRLVHLSNTSELAKAVLSMLSGGPELDEQRARQEEAYTAGELGTAVRLMADALEQMVVAKT